MSKVSREVVAILSSSDKHITRLLVRMYGIRSRLFILEEQTVCLKRLTVR